MSKSYNIIYIKILSAYAINCIMYIIFLILLGMSWSFTMQFTFLGAVLTTLATGSVVIETFNEIKDAVHMSIMDANNA